MDKMLRTKQAVITFVSPNLILEICMKNYAPFFTAITSLISFVCFAQNNKIQDLNNLNSETTNQKIIGYHVEEHVNMRFGSQITTYTVSDLRLVSTADLGPNNRRVITPKYAKQKTSTQTAVALASPVSVEETVAERPTSVNIDLIATYERVLEKGYKSEKLLKSVANEYFFNGNLSTAAKWYDELFSMNTNLEAMYYYRYSKSLASVNQLDKSAEMMKIFESRN